MIVLYLSFCEDKLSVFLTIPRIMHETLRAHTLMQELHFIIIYSTRTIVQKVRMQQNHLSGDTLGDL